MTRAPTEAIIFLSILGGIFVLLCIIFQMLKRDLCCRVVAGGAAVDGVGEEEEENENGVKKRQNATNGHGRVDAEENGVAGPTSSAVHSSLPQGTQQRQPRAGSRRVPLGETVIELSEFGDRGEAGEGGSNTDAVDGRKARRVPSLQLPSPNMLNLPPTPSDIDASESASSLGALVKKKISTVVEVEEPAALAGRLLVEFTYIPGAEKLNVLIIRADSVPEKGRGGSTNIMVHLTILPTKKQRFKTKLVPSSKGVFNERFQFVHVTPDIIMDCTLRMRLYGKERFSKRIIGEINIPMKDLDLTSPLCDEPRWKTLFPKGVVADIAGYEEKDSDEETKKEH